LVGGGARGYTRGAQVRKVADGLSAIVQQALGQPPCAGSVFAGQLINRFFCWRIASTATLVLNSVVWFLRTFAIL